MRRGDTTAASFALWEFLREAVHIEYLLHHAYMPYYKWAWRGMENLSGAQEMQKRIETLANERPERDHWKAVGEVQEVNWDDPIVCQIEQIFCYDFGSASRAETDIRMGRFSRKFTQTEF